MRTNGIVSGLKTENEDFEWYPTTQEIVDSVAKWISRNGECTGSILDIGCGNGGFFEKLGRTDFFKSDDYGTKNYESKLSRNFTKYGIEKSNLLAELLPDDVILLGSDFHSNTLIDKKVDCIFCNPPYSEYEDWTERIITEGNAGKIVLVIPSRWKDSERIKLALERREYSAETIGTFDFSNAERKARAKVDVIGILPKLSEYGRKKQSDPFDLWFDSTFSLSADKKSVSEYDADEKKKNEIFKSGDTAEDLVRFYNADMEKLYENYRSLENLDAEIFKELKVDVAMLKKSLRERLKNLKVLYWDLLFKKYDKLTQRLSTKGRDRVIKRLNGNTAIDFTLDNIYQLTLWMIKHSNTLFDEQLTDFFFTLSRSENIHRYKSNLRWNDSDWKYLKEKVSDNWCGYRADKGKELLKNIMLDYRIVVTGWKNFETDWKSRLSDSVREFLYDVCVIGKNLGYDVDFELPKPYDNIDLSEWGNFDIKTRDGKVFCNVKLYKNGNRHLKFCIDFMKKLNVEMARINGWIHDKAEAVKEFGYTEKEMDSIWKGNLKIGIGDGRTLLGLPNLNDEVMINE